MNQKLIDAIVGVLKQGDISISNDICSYRAEGGRKCVAGQLLPDAKYYPDMEGALIGDERLRPIMMRVLDDDVQAFEQLEELQRWHDRLYPRKEYDTTEAWRRYAIDNLPEFVDQGRIKDECHKAGVLL